MGPRIPCVAGSPVSGRASTLGPTGMRRKEVFSVLTAVLAVSALVGCITARASSSWQLAHGAASSQMLASNLNRCCQEKPTDAPNPPDPTKADTLTAHKVGKILGLS